LIFEIEIHFTTGPDGIYLNAWNSKTKQILIEEWFFLPIGLLAYNTLQVNMRQEMLSLGMCT
jgi:hypothetical protein